MSYSEEFKIKAIVLAASVGVKEAAKTVGIASPTLYKWIREGRENPVIQQISSETIKKKKFSPEFKEKVVAFAEEKGNAAAANEFGVSTDAVREWRYLKKTFGSASHPNPRNRHGKEKSKVILQNETDRIDETDRFFISTHYGKPTPLKAEPSIEIIDRGDTVTFRISKSHPMLSEFYGVYLFQNGEDVKTRRA